MTDGEPHVMASPVRLIAPLYQIHPRPGVAGRPDHVESCAFSEIFARSAHRFSSSRTRFFFFCSISSPVRGILFCRNCRKLIFRNTSEKLLECEYLISVVSFLEDWSVIEMENRAIEICHIL